MALSIFSQFKRGAIVGRLFGICHNFTGLIIKQRYIKHLLAPFRSNFSSEIKSNMQGIPYSKSLCHQSCCTRDLLAACGTVDDYWQSYLISTSIASNGQSHDNDRQSRKCIRYFLSKSSSQKPYKCINKCEATEYQTNIVKV